MKEIDLHGKNQTEAQVFLSKQLLVFKAQGEDKVRVITGQGNHSKTNGVLQKKVPKWLNGAKFKSVVSSFIVETGNPGALIVYLKLNVRSKFKSIRHL